MTDILLMCNVCLPKQELTFNINASRNQSEFDACKMEIEFSVRHLEQLANQYQARNDILDVKSTAEMRFISSKKNMELQNTIFNILNVFAWLPLLLTNIKRICYEQSPRLFHYVGSEYNKQVAWTMLDAIAPIQPTQGQTSQTPDTLNHNRSPAYAHSTALNVDPMFSRGVVSSGSTGIAVVCSNKEQPTFRGLTVESSDFSGTMDPTVKPREVEPREFRKSLSSLFETTQTQEKLQSST